VVGSCPGARVRESQRAAPASSQAEIERLANDCSTLRSQAGRLESEHKAASDNAGTAGEEVARLTERVAGLTKQTEEHTKQTTTLEVQRKAAANESKAGRGLGPKNESGRGQKPAIIVNLPEQRTMIIDSMVPLASYERLIAAKDEAEIIRPA
jgi:DNA anti-recombination protein RmuC